MITKPPADIRVRQRPDLLPGLLHVEVSCPLMTTIFPHVPTAVSAPVSVEMAATFAAIEHRSTYAHCDLGDVFSKGSPWALAAVNRLLNRAVDRVLDRVAADRYPSHRRN